MGFWVWGGFFVLFCSLLTPLNWKEVGRWGKYRYDVWSYRGSQCGCYQTAFTKRSDKGHSTSSGSFCFSQPERSRAVESGVTASKK